MLSSDSQRVVDQLIEAAISDSRERIAREEDRVELDTTKRGVYRSSSTLVLMWEALKVEIGLRAKAITDAYIQVLGADPAQLEEVTAANFRAELERVLPPDVPDLRHYLDQLGRRVLGRPEPLPLEETRERAIQKAVAGFDLWLLGAKRAVSAPGRAPVFHIAGSVGAIQTGPHASATVQMASEEERAQLVAALDRLVEMMEQQDLPQEVPQAEVLDLVAEVRQEVQKPELNRLRVAALGSAVAGSIQTAASLQPAYQAIRAALSFFGVPIVP